MATPGQSQILRVKLTGKQAFWIDNLLHSYDKQVWRPVDFRIKIAECIHKLEKIHKEADYSQADSPKVMNMPIWQARFLLEALLEWKKENYRVRKIGTHEWVPIKQAEFLRWLPNEIEVGRKSRLVDEAIELFASVESIGESNGTK